jgi:outer membrane protein TolC
MKLRIFLCALGLILSSVFSAPAQEILTLEQAVKSALQNNYDIRLLSNDLEINRNNVTKAALLPTVTGSLSNTTTLQNTKQTQSSGQEVTRDNAKNSNLNYGVGLNWRIFDGFSMFAAYDRLKEFEKLGELNLKSAVLATVYDVVNTYYEVIRQQKQLDSYQTNVDISRFRLTTAENRYQIGKAAKLEVLAATVDLNTDTTNVLRQYNLLKSAKIRLNELLARDVNTAFAASDTIIIDPMLKLDDILNASLQQNPSLQIALISQRIAELNLKEVKGGRYPVVGLSTGYNFSRSQSELGFARQSNGRGFNYGITASVNIFNGFLQKRNEKNAQIAIESSKLDYQKLDNNIRSQLASAYQTYQTNIQLVALEAINQNVAKQNLDITLEKFRLGSIAPIEFREAQRNFVDASARYSDAQYNAKLAEITLKEIAGNLDFQ